MGKLSVPEEWLRFFILLWGKHKIGKTVLASQAPKPFFVDLDGGIASVRSMRHERQLDFDFDVIHVDDSETEDSDFKEICGERMAKLDAWEKSRKLITTLSRTMPKDTTLIVDNLSRLSEYLLSHIMAATSHRPLQIQDWGTYVSEMTDVANALHSSKGKCDVIFIAHEEYHKDETTGEVEKMIWCPTKFRHRLPSIAVDFLYMKTDVRGAENKRRVIRLLQSVPDQRTAVGSRSLIPDVEDPTFSKMKPYLERATGRNLGEVTWTP